ncbi:MAG: response regulator [bacterium]|nr:response regulator [bacterium]MDT8395464.1 response regulator [bacterium]
MSKRILVVEDSPMTRSLIVSSLEELGDFTVIEAANGFQALRKLPEVNPDLVITDINMPDINGLEVVRFVKQSDNFRHIPVIIVTTEGRDVDKERGLRLGADRYLIKPFEAEELQRFVQELLG